MRQLVILMVICLVSGRLTAQKEVVARSSDNVDHHNSLSRSLRSISTSVPCKTIQPLVDKIAATCNGKMALTMVGSCKSGFVRLGDHCYFFSKESVTWYEARRRCTNLGATLAHPMNTEENTLLARQLQQSWWWLGGSNEAVGGHWKWADTDSVIRYFNWASRYPKRKSTYHCLFIYADGYQWGDYDCNYESHYVCQH